MPSLKCGEVVADANDKSQRHCARRNVDSYTIKYRADLLLVSGPASSTLSHDAGSTRTGPMNALIVGANKSDFSSLLPERFLLIDDGEISDALTFPSEFRVERLDLSKHHYNPLKGIDYRRARQLSETIYAAAPQGENTLTVRNGKRALTRLLLDCSSNPSARLDKLHRNARDPFITEANATVDDLLLSPVVRQFVATKATNFHLDGIVLAKLDRRVLSDIDAFFIGNLLISAYQGQIVVPDFGFYACLFHVSLIRQDRLIAGVNFLDEAPAMRNVLLGIKDKRGAACTAEDAETLASYCSKFARGTEGFAADVAAYMA